MLLNDKVALFMVSVDKNKTARLDTRAKGGGCCFCCDSREIHFETEKRELVRVWMWNGGNVLPILYHNILNEVAFP